MKNITGLTICLAVFVLLCPAWADCNLDLLAHSVQLGDLRPSEINAIQERVDSLDFDVLVVGSAAKGQRRHIGSDLPLGGASKTGTRSDIDYVVKDGLDDLATQAGLPEVDPGYGVRGVSYINLDKGPAILFRPHMAPELLAGHGRLPL